MHQRGGGGGQAEPTLFEDTSAPQQPMSGNMGGAAPSGGGYPGGQQPGGATPFQQYGQYMNDPVVANMAMQYGSSLATSGKAYVEQNLDRYIPVSRVKFYFAVTTDYVMHKILLLLLPFMNKEWGAYNSGTGEPTRHLNSPDLYIPLMGFATYVVVVAIALGSQGKFTPEMLGMTATTAFVWLMIEIGIVQLAMYLISVTTDIKIFDLAAFSGYKFVHMIVCVISSMLLGSLGYYISFIYASSANVYFLICTLRYIILPDSAEDRIARGSKRRNNLLLLIAFIQPLIIFWLTHHVTYGPDVVEPTKKKF